MFVPRRNQFAVQFTQLSEADFAVNEDFLHVAPENRAIAIEHGAELIQPDLVGRPILGWGVELAIDERLRNTSDALTQRHQTEPEVGTPPGPRASRRSR